MRRLGFTLSCCLGGTVASAQGHGPLDSEPQGVVFDERLQPLAGVTVRIVARQPSGTFAKAIAAELAAQPLPTARSGRDGSWVMPINAVLRRLDCDAWSRSGLWLVAERDGYLPWREPLPAGLAHWLGSRIVLRAVKTEDPFAALPWPPALVDHATQQGFWPWLSLDGAPFPELPEPATLTPPSEDLEQAVTIDLRVEANGKPVAGATLWFDDVACSSKIPGRSLPTSTDAGGSARAIVPGGKKAVRLLRVIAVGHVASLERIAATSDQRYVVHLEPARFVDMLAVAEDGKPVPFAKLSVVPRDGERGAFTRFADACGRARIPVASPADWFVYGDRGQAALRIDLAQPDSDGIVRVPHRNAVTICMRGDDWPRQGQLLWEAANGNCIGRAFAATPPAGEFVVLRHMHRDDAKLEIGGDERPSFVLRASDLPPPPSDPLLDLVALDRRVRVRAKLTPRSADGSDVLRFLVRPKWQAGGTRRGDEIRCVQKIDGEWLLRLRDDGPHELAAIAFRHLPTLFQVPAAGAGHPVPVLPLTLQPQ